MKKLIALTLALATPACALAQIKVTNVNSIISSLGSISTTIVYVLIGVAVIFIVWNGLQFIRFGGDTDKRGEYQSAIIWGIIGLAVILSIWGLVAVLKNTFQTDDAQGQNYAKSGMSGLIIQDPNPHP